MPFEGPTADQHEQRSRSALRRRRTAIGSLLFVLLAVTVTQVIAATRGEEPAEKGPATASAGEGDSGAQRPDSSRKPLQKESGLYPRAIRLEHSGEANGRILASAVSFDSDNGLGIVHESTDDGSTFKKVGTVADPAASGGKGLCCSTLYELPRRIGDMAEGTLLWADSPGQDRKKRRMPVKVFKSTDTGRSWTHLSTVDTAGNEGGLWEPEFSVDATGRLVVHYSDESDPGHSQKLVAARTSDGKRWTGHKDTVASELGSDRPGMAVVRRLPTGKYIMVYEICTPGGKYQCVVHYRTSKDGWDWGDPANLGIRPETADGEYLAHAPNLAWAPEKGNRQGRLILVGQVTHGSDGSRSPASGRTIWTNRDGGRGDWQTKRAPVSIRSGKVDFCPNYSSSLLPGRDGRSVLEIATDYDASGTCRPYYATGRI